MSTKNGSANGAVRQRDEVRVAIVGVGNCASSFVQGVEYYKDADPDDFVPGLMHVDLGGYHIRDIKFTAAFDIDADKVGKDLSEAIWRGQNNTMKFADVPNLGVKVQRGMTHDGLGKYLKQKIKKAPGPDRRHRRASCARPRPTCSSPTCPSAPRRRPSGTSSRRSPRAARSSTASPSSSRASPTGRSASSRPACRSSATTSSRRWARRSCTARWRGCSSERGVRLERTSQLNVGGNMDFYNMLERERLESKKISKTNAVTSMLDYELPADDVYIGPSDYVPWLKDRKWAHIRIEGESFGGVPLNMELKLEVWDSPNSAGIVIDAVRLCKLALNNGISGALTEPSSYLMKSPPEAGARPGRARPDREVHRRPRAQAGRRPPRQSAKAKAARTTRSEVQSTLEERLWHAAAS